MNELPERRTPIDRLLSSGDEAPSCRVIASDVSVHWWASVDAAPGTPCLCGATVRKSEGSGSG